MNPFTTFRDFSKREWEIIELRSQGFLITQVAYKCELAEKTVKWHLTNIYRKLGIKKMSKQTQLNNWFNEQKGNL